MNKKAGYIDRNGKIVINPQFDEAGDFNNGLAVSRCRTASATSTGKGKFAINPQFDQAGDFDHGLAPVWLGDRQGYINREGRYVWNPTA